MIPSDAFSSQHLRAQSQTRTPQLDTRAVRNRIKSTVILLELQNKRRKQRRPSQLCPNAESSLNMPISKSSRSTSCSYSHSVYSDSRSYRASREKEKLKFTHQVNYRMKGVAHRTCRLEDTSTKDDQLGFKFISKMERCMTAQR